MPKECFIGSQKKLRLLVEMSSALADEERLVLADSQTPGGFLITAPFERRAQLQQRNREPFHSTVRVEKGIGKIIVDA